MAPLVSMAPHSSLKWLFNQIYQNNYFNMQPILKILLSKIEDKPQAGIKYLQKISGNELFSKIFLKIALTTQW